MLDQLMVMLLREGKLDFLGGDKLIFLGDMIDRGIGSAAVIGAIRLLQTSYPENVVVLGGNHEWLMIDGLTRSRDDLDCWYYNGGLVTEQSFPGQKVPDEVIKWAAALPLFHVEPGFFFSHAPIPHSATPPYKKHELVWSYPGGLSKEAAYAKAHDGAIGVCGHIHALQSGVFKPRFYDHYIYADAGCGCHRKAPLVAIEVKSRDVLYAWPEEAMETQS